MASKQATALSMCLRPIWPAGSIPDLASPFPLCRLLPLTERTEGLGRASPPQTTPGWTMTCELPTDCQNDNMPSTYFLSRRDLCTFALCCKMQGPKGLLRATHPTAPSPLASHRASCCCGINYMSIPCPCGGVFRILCVVSLSRTSLKFPFSPLDFLARVPEVAPSRF